MPITRDLLRGQITLSEAKSKETNILQELTYVTLAANFRDHIEGKSAIIKEIIAHHLRLSQKSYDDIIISDRSEWLNGSFNLCVPISIQNQKQRCGNSKRVLIRFPLPYKTAELFRPGNGDEKVRCEAATYAWLSQECPNLPITCLHGFGLSTGQRFTTLKNTSFWTRCIQYLKRKILSLFRYPIPCQYVRHQSPDSKELRSGYLLIDYIEDGKMLSESYVEQVGDTTRRSNLFHDLAKIQLTLSQKPLPRIGSFTIDDNAILSLTNRPFTLEVCNLENQNVPVDEMTRDTTYSTVETYVSDILSLIHDNRLRYQPNGATSRKDCITQMSALSIMRTIYSDFFDRKLRSGPFALTFTDMHASNLFVDNDWHIKNIIDLEWACSRPIEMQRPPSWLTNQEVDVIDTDRYSEMYNEYIDAFGQMEKETIKEGSLETTVDNDDLFYTKILKDIWEKGTFWYCLALDSPSALHNIFYKRILPKYSLLDETAFDNGFHFVAPIFWSGDAIDLMVSRGKDKKKYDEKLREAFEVDSL